MFLDNPDNTANIIRIFFGVCFLYVIGIVSIWVST